MSSQRDRSPRRTLTSLPKEIITAISLFLPDRASVEALSFTSRHIHPSCERALWRSLVLSVSPRPRADNGEEAEAQFPAGGPNITLEITREIKDKIKRKIKALMNAGCARRWGMVEELCLELRPGAATGFLQILESVPNLRSLELRNPPQIPFYGVTNVPDHDTIDVRIIGTGINFPSLTHLTIGKGAIRFTGFLPLLCNASPSLVSLMADLSGRLSEAWPAGGVVPPLPSYQLPTKIQQLRLAYPTNNDGARPVVALLKSSPKLRRLHLTYIGTHVGRRSIAYALAELADLEALAWDVTPTSLWSALHGLGGRAEPLLRLRTLVIRRDKWHEIFEDIHPMPALEAIFFDDSPSSPLPLLNPTSFPEPGEVLPMFPNFARHLAQCPRLHHIHILRDVDSGGFEIFARTARIISSGPAECVIRSLSRGGKPELLHARLLSEFHELSDDFDHRTQGEDDDPSKVLAYETDEGSRVKLYEKRAGASWQDFTYYNGKTVPLDILAKMRKVEGVEVGAWEGRGMKVGKAAWNVLTDWAASETPGV